MEWIRSKRNRKNPFRVLVVIFFGACLLAGIVSFQYYNQLQLAIKEESRGYLQEVAKRISGNIDTIVHQNYGILDTLAATIQTLKIDSFAQVKPLVDAQRESWGIHDLLLVDNQGKTYKASGEEVVLNNDVFYEAVFAGKRGITTAQLINNQEYIVMVAPTTDIVLQGKQIVALAASYAPASFEQTLSMSSFNGQADSCIITKTGAVAVRSTVESTAKFGYNVIASIADSTLDKGDSMQQVKADLLQDHAGQIGFTQNGTRYYMMYTPIQAEGWHLLVFVPATVVNERSDMLLGTTLVICGVLTLLFSCLLGILMYNSYRNKQRLEGIAYVDSVTGGNTIQRFYSLAAEALAAQEPCRYALVYTNMQKFKVMNEQFSRATCDAILVAFYRCIAQDLSKKECIGRLFADNFCVLLEYENQEALLERFKSWYEFGSRYVAENKTTWPMPATEFGVYVLGEEKIAFAQCIDRAKMALRDFPRMINSRLRYAIYNDEAHQKLFREKQLEDMMEQSLLQGEFQVYLQPKYCTPTQTIGGAEALVRWLSKTDGMIYPNEFIPLFEKNGFIIQLDLWVFEQVCMRLRAWIDKGLQPVKISVNCSRVQLNDPNFLQAYRVLAQQYQVPASLVEIELTESVVMEDVHRLTQIIDEIHSFGFGCSMDDFGSGYSSLNLIQSIPVDTLKLDKIFFQKEGGDDSRTESVVNSIVSMAKALSMETVAEGVEHRQQIEMLQRVGCDYIQGYVFARPMPISDFEKLVYGETYT